MFGYKNHVGIDREHGFVRRFKVTHAAFAAFSEKAHAFQNDGKPGQQGPFWGGASLLSAMEAGPGPRLNVGRAHTAFSVRTTLISAVTPAERARGARRNIRRSGSSCSAPVLISTSTETGPESRTAWATRTAASVPGSASAHNAARAARSSGEQAAVTSALPAGSRPPPPHGAATLAVAASAMPLIVRERQPRTWAAHTPDAVRLAWAGAPTSGRPIAASATFADDAGAGRPPLRVGSFGLLLRDKEPAPMMRLGLQQPHSVDRTRAGARHASRRSSRGMTAVATAGTASPNRRIKTRARRGP